MAFAVLSPRDFLHPHTETAESEHDEVRRLRVDVDRIMFELRSFISRSNERADEDRRIHLERHQSGQEAVHDMFMNHVKHVSDGMDKHGVSSQRLERDTDRRMKELEARLAGQSEQLRQLTMDVELIRKHQEDILPHTLVALHHMQDAEARHAQGLDKPSSPSLPQASDTNHDHHHDYQQHNGSRREPMQPMPLTGSNIELQDVKLESLSVREDEAFVEPSGAQNSGQMPSQEPQEKPRQEATTDQGSAFALPVPNRRGPGVIDIDTALNEADQLKSPKDQDRAVPVAGATPDRSPSEGDMSPDDAAQTDGSIFRKSHAGMTKKQSEAFEELVQTALEDSIQYPVRESAWDAALFIGMPIKLSPADSYILIMAFVIQAVVQGIFCYVVIHLVSENLEDLKKKHNNLDIGLPECEEQRRIFKDYIQDGGPLLSSLVVLIWTLWVLKEIRRIADFHMAIWCLNKGKHTRVGINQSSGKIEITKISWGRLFFMSCNTCVQFAIAAVLLALGAVWLASTTILPDLLLNSVALQFIMEIDELVYHVLCSGKVKAIVRSVQPLQLPRRIVMPNRFPARSIGSLIVWLFFFLIMFVVFLNGTWHQIATLDLNCDDEPYHVHS